MRTRILGGNFLAVPSDELILSEVAMSRNGVGLASLEILQETRRLRLWSSVHGQDSLTLSLGKPPFDKMS